MKKITLKQLEEFKKWVYHYQKEFGLSDWKIYVDKFKLNNEFAHNHYNNEGRVSNISIAEELDDEVAQYIDPRGSAKHETIHLILADLYDLAKSRFTTQEQINIVEESIVRRLEKLIK
jgi:hypothetical protein